MTSSSHTPNRMPDYPAGPFIGTEPVQRLAPFVEHRMPLGRETLDEGWLRETLAEEEGRADRANLATLCGLLTMRGLDRFQFRVEGSGEDRRYSVRAFQGFAERRLPGLEFAAAVVIRSDLEDGHGVLVRELKTGANALLDRCFHAALRTHDPAGAWEGRADFDARVTIHADGRCGAEVTPQSTLARPSDPGGLSMLARLIQTQTADETFEALRALRFSARQANESKLREALGDLGVAALEIRFPGPTPEAPASFRFLDAEGRERDLSGQPWRVALTSVVATPCALGPQIVATIDTHVDLPTFVAGLTAQILTVTPAGHEDLSYSAAQDRWPMGLGRIAISADSRIRIETGGPFLGASAIQRAQPHVEWSWDCAARGLTEDQREALKAEEMTRAAEENLLTLRALMAEAVASRVEIRTSRTETGHYASKIDFFRNAERLEPPKTAPGTLVVYEEQEGRAHRLKRALWDEGLSVFADVVADEALRAHRPESPDWTEIEALVTVHRNGALEVDILSLTPSVAEEAPSP